MDYTSVPYCQLNADGTDGASTGDYYKTALTGKQYPAQYYKDFGAAPAGVAASKMTQLDVLTFTPGPIDPMYGLPTIAEITDGTSNSITFYEDVGNSDKLFNTLTTGCYYDAVTGQASSQWRWASPDVASGMSKKVNNNKLATATTPDPNGDGCVWSQHDCGPNAEAFSFHGAGTHMVFADGHVAYIRESISLPLLRALTTRSEGRNEADLGDANY